MPPTWSSASSTTTGLPCFASRYPAVSPAGPPPSTSVGRSSGVASICSVLSVTCSDGPCSVRGEGERAAGPGSAVGDLGVERRSHPVDHVAVAERLDVDAAEALVARKGLRPLRRTAAHQLGPRSAPARAAPDD